MEWWAGIALGEDDLTRRLLCDLRTRACGGTFGWKRGVFRSADLRPSANPASPVSRAPHLCDGQKTGRGVLRPLACRALAGKDSRTRSHVHVDRASRIGVYLGVPDLAVEILSPGSVYKDREVKRKEYAQAGVAEYWIIDPEARTVDIYEVGRHFAGTDVLTSELFPGFSIPLAELFADK